MMIRLLIALGVFLFLGMWFLGADHGQFINPPVVAKAPVTAGTARATATATAMASEARQVFIPAQRVMEAEPTDTVLAETPSAVAGGIAAAADVGPDAVALPAQPEPELAALRQMKVPGGASVRAGPGREFGVIGDLSAGDLVMVLDETSSPGWVHVRVDGRGEGWVAAKLLRE